MKYLTRMNMGEVALATGLPLEELEEHLTYHEEAGNHHAPIPQPRDPIIVLHTPGVYPDRQGTPVGTDQGL